MITETTIINRELSLCQLYAYISQAFRYPRPATAAFLSDPHVIFGANEAARELWGEAAEKIVPVPGAAALEKEYIRIFGHTITAAAPLYELEYGEGQVAQQTYLLGELAGFYRAFGLKIASDCGERADHISIQCEYLSLLCYREVYAEEHNQRGGFDVCRDAHKKFLREHLARWGFSFAAKVESLADSAGHYARAARLLARLLRADCERFGVAEGRADLVVQLPEPEPSEKCGI